MNDSNNLKPIEKKGAFSRMGSIQKIAFIILILLIVIIIIFVFAGGFQDIYQFLFYIIVLIAVIGGVAILLKTVSILFQPRYYSPSEDIKTKLTLLSQQFKPDNVKFLYFVGSNRRQRVLAGEIIGVLGLPEYIGDIDKDNDGNTQYTELLDFEGKKIPKFKDIEVNNELSGDTLFYVKKGNFIFAKKYFIRCSMSLHSDLNGDVEIYDINPVPYGFYNYPFKQMQKDTNKIMIQNQLETILNTHSHQHDLISQSVDSAIYFNPYMRVSIKQQAELGGDE